MIAPAPMPPNVDRALYERQAATMTAFLALLNDISKLGVTGFGAVIDAATPDELGQLASSAAIVRQQIAKYQAAQGGVAPPPPEPA